MKRLYAGKPALFTRFAVLALILTSGALFGASRTIAVSPAQSPTTTTLAGKGWAYTVPFEVKNVADIEALIGCESHGQNISRPDSNGRDSDGILQYNRGPANTLASSTWAFFSGLSGIKGSPLLPADAIAQADWAISNGYLYRWTCAHLLGLTA